MTTPTNHTQGSPQRRAEPGRHALGIQSFLRVKYYSSHGGFPGCSGKPNSTFTHCQSSNMKPFAQQESRSETCPKDTPPRETPKHGGMRARASVPNAQARFRLLHRRAVVPANHSTTTTIIDRNRNFDSFGNGRFSRPCPAWMRPFRLMGPGFAMWATVSLP